MCERIGENHIVIKTICCAKVISQFPFSDSRPSLQSKFLWEKNEILSIVLQILIDGIISENEDLQHVTCVAH